MKEKIISNLTIQSGMNNRYQYISLIIIFTLYGTTDFLAISLPFLESKPLVSFKDSHNVTYVKSINYTICENYTFEIVKNYSSIVNELEIYCDRTKTSLIGTSLFFGVLLGSLVSYLFTDWLGRKKTVFLFSIFYLMTIVLFSFIYNIYIIYGLILISGFFYIIVALSAIILLNEIISENLVAMFTTIIYIAFFIFGLCYTYLFYELDNWRLIFRIIACIHLLSAILFFYYIEESPRFYVAKKDYANFMKTIKKIAIKNKLQLIEDDINLHITDNIEDSIFLLN
jgi:MFS family permease